MTENRRERMRALVTANDDGLPPALTRICGLAVSELVVTGAGVTLMHRPGTPDAQQRLARATDAVAVGLEDLQLTVGEGPGLSAVTAGAPVLVPDLAVAGARWPAFTPGALALGVAAVFAFPLQLGVIGLGSLDCHRAATGSLSPPQAVDGLVLAELAFESVLDEIAGRPPEDLGWISDIHAEVHQASGMVSNQLGISMREALLRIRAHAYAHDLPLATVARQIVDRQLLLGAQE
ncbi:hypothetical protein ALI144C_02545 [Actinosynnema sp. ALI-1.44]|uniref:ANTAR domain-containing protein n=1 Tax=Actinosynnema sp. ALI-1.44 TaxID=1933779 RepID=UPI00097CC095|nr:ANTAR domain-containing protein [Actinosynnema sp. ALI-1.44]ONI90580.1 hypothetical protein ALI144C_02545 [Actinosynnema sp. ALI-1.44]